MHSLRIALVLILSGVALPLICLPILDGYVPKAGLLGNIQEMTLPLPITRGKMEPDFREVASFGAGEFVATVEGEWRVGFPYSTTEDDVLAALNAEPRFKSHNIVPRLMRFYGWRVVQHGVRMPFKYLTFFGLLLVFAGFVLLVWRATKTRHETKAVCTGRREDCPSALTLRPVGR